MESAVKQGYRWKDIEVNNIVLPEELLIYYLYKLKIDNSTKRKGLIEEDLSYIKNYYGKMRGGIDVSEKRI